MVKGGRARFMEARAKKMAKSEREEYIKKMSSIHWPQSVMPPKSVTKKK